MYSIVEKTEVLTINGCDKKSMENMKVLVLSHAQLFATPWTVACLSMEFSKQEYWSD